MTGKIGMSHHTRIPREAPYVFESLLFGAVAGTVAFFVFEPNADYIGLIFVLGPAFSSSLSWCFVMNRKEQNSLVMMLSVTILSLIGAGVLILVIFWAVDTLLSSRSPSDYTLGDLLVQILFSPIIALLVLPQAFAATFVYALLIAPLVRGLRAGQKVVLNWPRL